MEEFANQVDEANLANSSLSIKIWLPKSSGYLYVVLVMYGLSICLSHQFPPMQMGLSENRVIFPIIAI